MKNKYKKKKNERDIADQSYSRIIKSRIWGYTLPLRKLIAFPKNLKIANTNKAKMHINLAEQAMKARKWEKATFHWQKVVELNNPKYKTADIYRKTGICYTALKKFDLSIINFKKYIELNTGLQLDKIISELEGDIEPKTGNLKSKYKYVGGRGNYGFIEHETYESNYNNKYLTKITSQKSINSQKESIFYSVICEQYPELKSITPHLVNIKTMKEGNLKFLTLEKVKGKRPEVEQDLKYIVDLQRIISSVKFKNMQHLASQFESKKYFCLNDLSIPAPKRLEATFANISKGSTNEAIFKWIYSEVYALGEKNIIHLINKLKYLIYNAKMYEKLDSVQNFALQHGDFSKYNILIDKKTSNVNVIDWRSYFIGPVGFDIAYFFRKEMLTFDSIDKIFLSNPRYSDLLTLIEKIFFVYTLIILLFLNITGIKFNNEYYYSYLKQATDRLEILVTELNYCGGR